ncbi:hypothetical protein [Tsukamurella ocularis]|uniref:hypothetical protein n=1 Tax=Tsukamurella ocularis TaxID=1970234 RepID=UPI00216867C6|nr:hypothetical protein [Tsukamurella ocularis]MCS3779414.1 hypothetical protein [Tsukamurella ocularis]MCS3790009.1 hypothetical protein [Tsukamurella ocularis]
MFDSRVWREKAVPVPCRVSISKALPHLARGSTRADKLPLWLRADGVRLEDEMDAELLRWARLNSLH